MRKSFLYSEFGLTKIALSISEKNLNMYRNLSINNLKHLRSLEDEIKAMEGLLL